MNPLFLSAEPSAADKLLKAQLQAKHVEELWLLLSAVIGILTFINWTQRLLNTAFRWEVSNAKKLSNVVLEGHIPGRTGNASLRRLPLAIATAFRVIAFRWTLPIGFSSVASMAEVIFILAYALSMLTLLWAQTRDFETFLFEDRAAHLASCQLPLIVALAGKNNIISFLTGIGHEKLNILHRASARICLILLWIHAMVRSAPGLPAVFALSNGWMRWGIVGLTAFTLATILSIRPIRHAAFEFFLVSHIFLIAIFLIGGLLHAREPGFGSYIWPALLLWGIDRLLRLVRVVFNNRIWKSKNGKESATVQLLSYDTVRLTLRRQMHWKAGQHAYITLPSISKLPTEAHPFSIASIPSSLDGNNSDKEKELVFLIRVRSGLTKRLREFTSEKGAKPVLAYIDGPYGNPPDLKEFSTCVLIAGGSGVSYTLPLLQDLISASRRDKISVQKILFVWIIRDTDHLNWITNVLFSVLKHAPPSLDVEYRIHVTGRKHLVPDVKSLEYEYADIPSLSSAEKLPFDEKKLQDASIVHIIKTKKGRPHLQRLLDGAITNAVGPVSVDVAGPSNLAQSVRSALCSDLANPLAVAKGRQPVTLHIETFGMVKGGTT